MKGVSFHKAARKWVARFGYLGEQKYLGIFETEQEAIAAVKFADSSGAEYRKQKNLPAYDDGTSTIREDVTSDFVRKKFNYNADFGLFTWADGRFYGNSAGYIVKKGGCSHRCINLNGKNYLVHRLVWLWVHGEWPDGDVRHKNRIGTDNRICNLILVPNPNNNAKTS